LPVAFVSFRVMVWLHPGCSAYYTLFLPVLGLGSPPQWSRLSWVCGAGMRWVIRTKPCRLPCPVSFPVRAPFADHLQPPSPAVGTCACPSVFTWTHCLRFVLDGLCPPESLVWPFGGLVRVRASGSTTAPCQPCPVSSSGCSGGWYLLPASDGACWRHFFWGGCLAARQGGQRITYTPQLAGGICSPLRGCCVGTYRITPHPRRLLPRVLGLVGLCLPVANVRSFRAVVRLHPGCSSYAATPPSSFTHGSFRSGVPGSDSTGVAPRWFGWGWGGPLPASGWLVWPCCPTVLAMPAGWDLASWFIACR
jgi:hypothetical protein